MHTMKSRRIPPEQLEAALNLMQNHFTSAINLHDLIAERAAHPQSNQTAAQAKYKALHPATVLSITQPAYHGLYTAALALDYLGNKRGTGLSAYIVALFAANPSIEDWDDTRPDNLTGNYDYPDVPNSPDVNMRDILLIRNGNLPLWYDEDYATASPYERRRKPRHFPSTNIAQITPLALRLSAHYGISYQNRNTTSSRVASVLEAIGLSYLTPYNKPLHNQHPVNPHRHLRRARSFYDSTILPDERKREFNW